jgi:hypothetical protein
LRKDLAAFAGRPVSPSTSPAGDLGILALPRTRVHLPGPSGMIAIATAVVGLTLTFAVWYWSQRADTDAAATANPAADQAAASAAAAAAQAAAASKAAAAASAASQASTAAREAAAANLRTGPKIANARPKPAPLPPPPPPPAPVEPGTLGLAITPWGEVFVDGSSAGVAPPLSRLDLAPGSHAIEVRNGNFPVYAVTVEIEPGKTFSLQHHF